MQFHPTSQCHRCHKFCLFCNHGFHCSGQMADSVYGVVWVSGMLMLMLWIEWSMVAVGLWYGQAYVMDNGQQVHFIDGILKAPRYFDEILRPIVVPFIHDHHLMLQHDNALPHVARICTQFLEAETSQFLHGQHSHRTYTHRTCPPFEHVWDALDRRIRQCVPVPANIQQLFAQPLKRSGPTFHRLLSTTWSTLCEGDVLHCVRQMGITPDTDWFSDPPGPPRYSKTAHLEWPA